MKKIFFILLAVVLALSVGLIGCAAPTQQEEEEEEEEPEPIVLKALTYTDPLNPIIAGFEMLCENVEELSNGELVIERIGGPEAVPTFEQVEAVRTGVADMVITFSSAYAGLVPGLEAFEASRLTIAETRDKGIIEFWRDYHEEVGLFFLGITCPGSDYAHIFSNVYLEGPEDLANLEMAGTGEYVLVAYGASSVWVRAEEQYTALEQGIIDGIIWSPVSVVHWSLYDLLDYVVEHPLFSLNIVTLVNLDTFNSLPEHLQEALLEAEEQTEDEFEPFWAEKKAECLQTCLDSGLELITWPPEVVESFYENAYEAHWDLVIEQDPVEGPIIKDLYTG